AHRGGAQSLDRGQALRGVLAAARDCEGAEGAGPFETRPEPDEEPEGEREEDPVFRAQARAPQDEAPAPRPPLPGFLRVEPAERRTGGPRRLVHAHVAVERIAEIAAERR